MAAVEKSLYNPGAQTNVYVFRKQLLKVVNALPPPPRFPPPSVQHCEAGIRSLGVPGWMGKNAGGGYALKRLLVCLALGETESWGVLA